MSSTKILLNSIYYGIIPKLSLFISIVILPLTTPYLTTIDYGITGIVTSYTNFIVCIAPLGLHLHLTNSFYEIPKYYNLLWGRILYCFIISGIGFGIINMIILVFSLSVESIGKLILISFLGSFPVFLFANNILAQHLFPLLAKPIPLVFTNLIASCCSIIVSFIMIYYFKLGYWGMLVGPAIGCVISYIIFIKQIWLKYSIYPIKDVKLNRLTNMLKSSLPLIPHTLGFILLSSSSRIIMNIYGIGYDEIGLFSHGCAMGDYIVIVTTALTTALIPQMQTSYRQNNYSKFRKLYYLCQGVSLISSFLICIWMRDIYDILIHNEDLKQSASIAVLLCFTQALMPLYYFISISAFVERKTKQLLWLVFIPGFLNIVICSIFIPIYGYSVAIYSTLISYWSQILMPIIIPYFKDKTKLWFGNKLKLIWLLIMSLGLLIIGNNLSFSSYFVKVIISLTIVLFGYMLIRKYKLFQVI